MSLEQAEKAIPAVVRMFSGCEDKQTSADGTFNVAAIFCLILVTYFLTCWLTRCSSQHATRQSPMWAPSACQIQPGGLVEHLRVRF